MSGKKKPMRTRKQDLTETIFGVPVGDPYRWLEESTPEVAQWTSAQNEHTQSFLGRCSERTSLRRRMQELLRTGYVMPPWPRRTKNGWRYFWTERRGDAIQPTLFFRDGNGEPRALIDVSKLSDDGTDALDWWYPSPDG